MRDFLIAGMIGIACQCFPVAAQAIDGLSFELGHGASTDMGRIGLKWNMNQQWLKGDSWHLGIYLDLSLGHWRRSSVSPGQNDGLTEVGLTPTLRWQQNDIKGLYFEGALGIHLLSQTSLGSRRFGTGLQFGSHLGFGYRFGAKSAFDVGVRYQHLSNGGISSTNDGINFGQFRVIYNF